MSSGGFRLTVIEGSGRGRHFRSSGDVLIGRGEDCHLAVLDPCVSRRHARILRGGDRWILRDEGSANGTALNGMPLHAEVSLRARDRVQVGSVVLAFHPDSDFFRDRRVRLLAAGVLLSFLIAAGMGWVFLRRHPTPAFAADPAPAPGQGHAALGAAQAPEPRADPAAALALLRKARQKLEQKRVAPRNLWDAWSSLVQARQLAGRGPQLIREIDELLPGIERELERDCRRLLFTAAKQERYGAPDRVQRTLRELLLRLPGNDPFGCRKQALERIEPEEPGAHGHGG